MNTSRKDRIFSTLFKEHDEVSLVEAYSLGKRTPQYKVKNRQWIGYKLAQWRKKGLVEAIYGSSAGSYGALIGIRLTKLGKTLLGKPIGPNHQNTPLAPADILELVRQLKRAHPEWEVTFEIRLKEQPVLSSSLRNN